MYIFKLEHVDVFPQCAAAVQSGHSRIMRNYLFIIQTIRHPPFVSTPQPWEVTRLTAIDSRIPDNNRGVYSKIVQENYVLCIIWKKQHLLIIYSSQNNPPYKNDVHREGVIFADQDLVIKWTVAKNIFTSYQIFLTIDKTTICSCNLSMVGWLKSF